MPRPKLIQATDLIVPASSSWDVPSVRQALDAHELGQFGQSGLLADAMTRDDRYKAVLNTRVLGLLGCPFELEPSDEGHAARAPNVARNANETLKDTTFSIETTANIFEGALQMGFSLSQLIWNTGDGDDAWTVTLKPWHPVFIYYRLDTRKYGVYAQEGAIDIEPGDGNWFLYAPRGPYRAWMQGAVRFCAIPYIRRMFTSRDWARYEEVHGLSPRKVKVPADASDADKMSAYQGIISQGSESVLQLPQNADGTGWDVELLEAQANTWQTFQASEDAQSKKFAVAILGQNLTTDVEGGSYAAATVHNTVRQDYREFDERSFATQLREQVLKPWAEYNYGDRRLAPRPKWKVEPPDDKKVKADTLVQVGIALTSLATVAPEVDRRKLLEGFDIEMHEPGDMPDVAPALPVAPPAPGEAPAPPAPGQAPAPPHMAPVIPMTNARTLARGTPPSALAGQAYVDAVGDKAVALASHALRPDVASVLAALHAGSSFDEVRRNILEHYRAMKAPERFAAVTANATTAAHLAGRHAVDLESAAE